MAGHAFLLLFLGAAPAATASEENVDLATIHRIKSEAFLGSHVMDHLFFLTDVNGPRLTNSPGFRAAADWSVRRLREWGVPSARLEKWGTFGRGWYLTRFSAHMQTPAYAPLPGIPKAWSAPTPGPITAEVVSAPVFTAQEDDDRHDLAKVTERIRQYSADQKGKLRGRIVLVEPARSSRRPRKPPASGMTKRSWPISWWLPSPSLPFRSSGPSRAFRRTRRRDRNSSQPTLRRFGRNTPTRGRTRMTVSLRSCTTRASRVSCPRTGGAREPSCSPRTRANGARMRLPLPPGSSCRPSPTTASPGSSSARFR